MADSKITQLPLSPYALDKDYIIAVTGHLEDGSHPYNVKMPLSYVRRYVVRLNLLTNTTSGIANYYNSGLNILTIWNTGIHAVPGNHVEVQFEANTPAANKYGGVGEICHSGIISVTGLNAYGGNRIDTAEDTIWPHSGIINTTGLNLLAGENIGYEIVDSYPHEYIVFNSNKNLYSNTNLTISNNQSGELGDQSRHIDNIDTETQANFKDLYASRANQNINLHCEYSMLLTNNVTIHIPQVPADKNQTNEQKERELSTVINNDLSFTYTSCSDSNPCEVSTITENDLVSDDGVGWEVMNIQFNSSTIFQLLMQGGIDSDDFYLEPLRFEMDGHIPNINAAGGSYSPDVSQLFREVNRNNVYNYQHNNIDPMKMHFVKKINIDSDQQSISNTINPTFRVYNVPFTRTYRKHVNNGLTYNSYCLNGECTQDTPVYRYVTTPVQYAAIDITISKRLLETKELNSNLNITITQDLDTNLSLVDGQNSQTISVAFDTNASNTTIQWQVDENGDGSFIDIDNENSEELTISNIDSSKNNNKYRARITSTNNPNSPKKEITIYSSTTTFSVLPPTISVTDLPSFSYPVDGNLLLSAQASIDNDEDLFFQWQTLTAGTWTNIYNYSVDALSLTNLSFGEDNNKQFRVIVSSNKADAVISNVTTLEIPQPFIDIQNNLQTIIEAIDGDSASLSVVGIVYGSNPGESRIPNYQWQRLDEEWTDLTGETNDTLVFDPVQYPTDSGYYRCVLSADDAKTVTSSIGLFQPYEYEISIIEQPSNTTASDGTASFSVDVSIPSDTAQIQWQTFNGQDWQDLPGENDTQLNINDIVYYSEDLTQNQILEYRAYITSTDTFSKPIITETVQLTVEPSVITINTQPPTDITTTNGSATISVEADITDAGSLFYEWFYRSDDQTSISTNIFSPNLVLENIRYISDNVEYYAEISSNSSVEPVISNSFTLHVDRPVISINKQPNDYSVSFDVAISGTTEDGDTLISEIGDSLLMQNTAGSANFFISAEVSNSFDPRIYYQWQKFTEGNWIDLQEETKSYINLNGLDYTLSGNIYRVKLSSLDAIDVYSESGELSIPPPVISFNTQPTNFTALFNNVNLYTEDDNVLITEVSGDILTDYDPGLAYFNVSATISNVFDSLLEPSYQWQIYDNETNEWTNIVNETNEYLYLYSVIYRDSGNLYRNNISLYGLDFISSTGNLLVDIPTITITDQPTNQNALDDSGIFTVSGTISENTNITYKWQKLINNNWVNYKGGRILDLSNLDINTLPETSSFRAIIESDYSNITGISNTVTYTVPAITIEPQPLDTVLNNGSGLLIMNATVTNSRTLDYAWKKVSNQGIFIDDWENGTTLSSTTGLLLQNQLHSANDGDQYAVIVAVSGHPERFEKTDIITVNVPHTENITITQDVTNQIYDYDSDSVTFSVSATSSGPALSYNWQYSSDSGETWTNIGTNSNTLTLSQLDYSNNNQLYKCIITADEARTQTSSHAVLTVPKPIITISQQPTNQDLATNDGLPLIFNVEASVTSNAELEYRWYVNENGDITELTLNTDNNWYSVNSYVISIAGNSINIDNADTYYYVEIRSDYADTVVSESVQITVPEITMDDSITVTPDQIVEEGDSRTLSANVSISNANSSDLILQWQYNSSNYYPTNLGWKDIPGETNDTLVLNALSYHTDRNRYYRLYARNRWSTYKSKYTDARYIPIQAPNISPESLEYRRRSKVQYPQTNTVSFYSHDPDGIFYYNPLDISISDSSPLTTIWRKVIYAKERPNKSYFPSDIIQTIDLFVNGEPVSIARLNYHNVSLIDGKELRVSNITLGQTTEDLDLVEQRVSYEYVVRSTLSPHLERVYKFHLADTIRDPNNIGGTYRISSIDVQITDNNGQWTSIPDNESIPLGKSLRIKSTISTIQIEEYDIQAIFKIEAYVSETDSWEKIIATRGHTSATNSQGDTLTVTRDGGTQFTFDTKATGFTSYRFVAILDGKYSINYVRPLNIESNFSIYKPSQVITIDDSDSKFNGSDLILETCFPEVQQVPDPVLYGIPASVTLFETAFSFSHSIIVHNPSNIPLFVEWQKHPGAGRNQSWATWETIAFMNTTSEGFTKNTSSNSVYTIGNTVTYSHDNNHKIFTLSIKDAVKNLYQYYDYYRLKVSLEGHPSTAIYSHLVQMKSDDVFFLETAHFRDANNRLPSNDLPIYSNSYTNSVGEIRRIVNRPVLACMNLNHLVAYSSYDQNPFSSTNELQSIKPYNPNQDITLLSSANTNRSQLVFRTEDINGNWEGLDVVRNPGTYENSTLTNNPPLGFWTNTHGNHSSSFVRPLIQNCYSVGSEMHNSRISDRCDEYSNNEECSNVIYNGGYFQAVYSRHNQTPFGLEYPFNTPYDYKALLGVEFIVDTKHITIIAETIGCDDIALKINGKLSYTHGYEKSKTPIIFHKRKIVKHVSYTSSTLPISVEVDPQQFDSIDQNFSCSVRTIITNGKQDIVYDISPLTGSNHNRQRSTSSAISITNRNILEGPHEPIKSLSNDTFIYGGSPYMSIDFNFFEEVQKCCQGSNGYINAQRQDFYYYKLNWNYRLWQDYSSYPDAQQKRPFLPQRFRYAIAANMPTDRGGYLRYNWLFMHQWPAKGWLAGVSELNLSHGPRDDPDAYPFYEVDGTEIIIPNFRQPKYSFLKGKIQNNSLQIYIITANNNPEYFMTIYNVFSD